MENPKKSVLFLCTGNSCRSQMAEAIVNARLGDRWMACSAGTEPAAAVHPRALQVLAEIGIEHNGQPSQVSHFRNHRLDLVITVCDAAAENCPVWLGKGKRVHISFPDPASAVGEEAELMQVFRDVRDAIAEQVLGYLQTID